jgi:hypothetical protein
MELQHIVIDGQRLLLAAQAHEERPIHTALQSYDIHDLDPPLPPPLEDLYVWLKWETLFAYYKINRLSKTLAFVPLFFFPLAYGVGRVWWFFFIISLFIGVFGVFLQQMYHQNFFYQRIEDFLRQQTFDIVGNKLIEYLPEIDALENSITDLELEIKRMEKQQNDLDNVYQKLEMEGATQNQLQKLHTQRQTMSNQKQIFIAALERTQASKTDIEQQRKHVIHDIQIQYASQQIQDRQRALIMLELNIPDIQNQIEEVQNIITRTQIEQNL